MTADIYSLAIRVDSTQVNRAESDLQRLQRESRQTERAMNSLSSSAKALAGAFAGISIGSVFTTAIKEIATFETKMNQLKALTMANTEQMKMMENQARSLGATTAFSAQQAAEAQGVLASTGLKANQIMSATPKILALAAAGNLDLAKAAEISMASMKGLGLQIEDLGHINDVFAKVAADSAISVEQVGVAMGEAAPSMRTFGISLEQTAAAIGILKDNGIKVGSIGDGLKSMMGALANETKEHNKILEKHNLSYKDLNVETLGLTKVLNNLKNANLSAKESIALLGLDAFNTSVILMNNTKALEGNSAALVKTSGDAQTQADILNQGLSKAWDALKGSLSEVALQMGETKAGSDSLAGGLTSLIQQATGVISIWSGLGNQFRESNKLTAEQYRNLKDIAGALSSFGSAAKGVAVLTAAIWSLRAAQLAFNIAARANPYIAGATALAAGTGYVYDKMNQFNERQKGHLKEIKTLEEANLGVQKQQQAVKNLTDVGASKKVIDEAKSRLDALKQQRDTFEKGAARPVLEIVDETEQWYSEGNTKKIKANSAAIDESGESAKKTGAAHKGLSDAQKQANQDQSLFKSLLERTPIGAYKASMDDLNYALKKGGIDTETYNYLAKQTADTFERATVGIKEFTEAEKERQQALAGSARGQFESGYSSLQKSKEFMTAKEYESKQNQLLDSYLSATGNKEEKKKESDDLTKSYENEIEALEKIRREINLNDTAAYEAAQRQKGFTDEQIAKLLEFRESVNMTKLWDDMGLSVRGLASSFGSMFSQVLTQGKSFTSALQGMLKNTVTKISDSLMNFGMNSLISGNWIAGITGVVGSISSGLLSGLFGDKEKDLRSPDTKIANSNSIQNVVKTLNDIHAKEYKELQGINDNFTLLTRNIDNTIARAVAWNGSFVPSTVGMTSSQAANGATKSALGGNSAAGIGVSGVTGAITGAGAAIYGATSAASALGVGLGGAGTAAIGAIGAVAGLAGGLILGGAIYGLGKLLGIGKTKYTAIGNGLVTQPAKLIESGIEDGFKAYNFSVVKATTKTWFGNKSKIFEVINGVNDEMSQAFGSIFGQLGTTLKETFSSLGISNLTDYNLQNTVIPALKMTLTGKSDAEISDIISGVVNTMTDKMATEIVGGLFEPFAKSGESMLETIYRLATQTAVVRANFHKVGIEVDATGMGAIALSDAIASIYESSIGAKDGLKQFTGAINDFYNAVLTQGEKVSMTIADYSAFVAANPQLGLSADASLVSGKQMMDAFKMASDAAQAAKDAAEPILNLGQAAKNAFAPETTNDLGSNNKAWVGAWQGVVNAPFSSMTPKDFKAGFWDIAKQWSQVQNEDGRFIAEIVRVAEANQAKIEQGTKEIAGLNITSLDQYTQQADAANESIVKTAKELKNVTDQTGAFTVIINEFQKKFKDLDETILASVTTNVATTKRARDKQLIELKEYDKQRISSNSLSAETKRLYAEYTKSTVEANDKTGYLTSTLQEVAWQAEDTAKSMNKLIDANKYVMDFSRGIKQWVENLRATQLGSPSTQIEAARRAFNEQLNLAKFAPDAETKRGALSGITGYADTFINAIKSFYGSSEEGQKQLQNVVDEVSNLEKGLSIQELQLGALQDIKDAIMDSAITIPKGISEESAKIYESLLSKAQIAGSEYKALPTVENALKFDAFAKVVMTIDKTSQAEDAKFVDALIKSVIGEKGISAAIDVVINNATLTGSQKESVLNNLTAEFNKALEGFNGLEKVASEITRVTELWNGIKLDSTPVNDAGIAVKGLTNDLVGLNGEYDVVITQATGAAKKVVDFGKLDERAKVGLDGVSEVVAGFNQITASANAARDAMNALAKADAEKRNQAILDAQIAKNAAVIAGTNADIKNTPAIAPSGLSISNLPTTNAIVGSSLINAGFSGTIQIPASASLSTEVLGGGASRGQSVRKSYFADGGAFTNGVVSKPTAFNIGLMGESGSEAIMPLVNIGGSLGVRAVNDSNVDTAKTIEELKTIVRQQDAMIRVMQDGFSKLQAENKEQNENLNNLASSVRLQARG